MSRSLSVHRSLFLIVGALLAAPAMADTVYVCWDGTGDYLTIQEGIDAAVDGDEVVVCDGTYTGDGNRDLDFGGRLITVRSENGPNSCIIDCEGSEPDPHRAFDFHSGETAAAVLEGLTIQNGYMINGGAISCAAASAPTIRDCVFLNNTAAARSDRETGHGGAIYCTDNGGATLLECTFVGNTAVAGTGIYSGMGGALACLYSGDVVVRECTFRDNMAIAHATETGDGGAIYFLYSGHLELTNCAFIGNTADGGPYLYSGAGGALISAAAELTLAHCTFVGNRAEGTANNGSAGALYVAVDDALVLNCTFAGNVARLSGGAVTQVSCSVTWVNCQFVGNVQEPANLYGGGAFLMTALPAVATPLWADLINCTLAGNRAFVRGGVLWIDNASGAGAHAVVNNGVLWGNDALLGPQGFVGFGGYPATVEVWYSDVQAGEDGFYVQPPSELIWGDGNIDEDPQFVGGPSGTWTMIGVYNPDSTQTTFTDDNAAWTPDELVGKFLNPDTTQYLQSLITANTETTVTVWGNFEALGTAGASYQINDYHLTSGSPCIDAADNTAVPPDEWDLDVDGDVTERIPLDLDCIRRFTDRPATVDTGVDELPDYPQIVDMGPYEYGTFGDLDGDCDADLADLAGVLASYGATVGVGYDHGDLNLDEDVGLSDLAALLSVYGTTCE